MRRLASREVRRAMQQQTDRGGRLTGRGDMQNKKHRIRGDGGAAAVEFALLFPIFMVLALGTIAAGIAFSKQLNVTQAAREASRFGATYNISTIGAIAPATNIETWLSAVDEATKQAAGAADDPIGGYDYRCVAFVTTTVSPAAPGVDVARSVRKVNGGASEPGLLCDPIISAVANIRGTDYAQVAVARDTQFFVLDTNARLQLDSVSLTPYEGK